MAEYGPWLRYQPLSVQAGGEPGISWAVGPPPEPEPLSRIDTGRGGMYAAAREGGGIPLSALAETWPARLAQTAWTAAMEPGRVMREGVDDSSIERMADLAGFMTGTPGGVGGLGSGARAAAKPGIRAYHGSPHDFDRFDMSKIGTGQGAQTYGHGLYFAENPAVAKSYKGTSQSKDVSLFDPVAGQHVNQYQNWQAALGPALKAIDPQIIQTATRKAADAIADATQTGTPVLAAFDAREAAKLAQWRKNKVADHIIAFEEASNAKIRKALEQLDPQISEPVGGKMYETTINASPDEFLDWDAPLSQQPQKVREALQPLIDSSRSTSSLSADEFRNSVFADSGSAVINDVKTWAGKTDQQIAEALRAAGIKGIRYKDQGSRGAEGGTSNYVVFDADVIQILKKYGIAGLAALGGAGAVAGSGGEAQAGPWMDYE